MFAQRVWARHTEGGGGAELGWAGLFGVAQSAAQCNGIYCNLHFNAQMSFLYAPQCELIMDSVTKDGVELR